MVIVRRRAHALEFIYPEWGNLQCDGEIGVICFDSREYSCGVDNDYSRIGSLPLVVRNMHLLECALLNYPFIGDVIFNSTNGSEGRIRVKDVITTHFVHSGHGSFGINLYYQGNKLVSLLHPTGLYRCLDDIVFISRDHKYRINARQFIEERLELNEFADCDIAKWGVSTSFNLSAWMEELGLEKLLFVDRMMIDEYQSIFILGFKGMTILTDPITMLSDRFVEVSKKAVRANDRPVHLASSIYPFVPNLYSRMFVGEVEGIDMRVSYGYISSDKYCAIPKGNQLVFKTDKLPSGDALFCEYDKERFLDPVVEPLSEEDV